MTFEERLINWVLVSLVFDVIIGEKKFIVTASRCRTIVFTRRSFNQTHLTAILILNVEVNERDSSKTLIEISLAFLCGILWSPNNEVASELCRGLDILGNGLRSNVLRVFLVSWLLRNLSIAISKHTLAYIYLFVCLLKRNKICCISN